MVKLTEVDLVRCVVIGDEESNIDMMMKKYATYSGVPYDSERHELVTAFNGRKCVFVDSSLVEQIAEEPHVYLLCVSVASRTEVEEMVGMILDTLIARIRGVPFVLVGTQIEKRLSMLIENNVNREIKYLPMALNQAEMFAKRIGASKYYECSEVTGEGIDEVFEGAFEIGHNCALEKMRGLHRKLAQLQETTGIEKPGCITH
ncbi:hypothetical protein GCK32_004853 [Trichostrongylus colubriformis]|uniref:Ras family protein n=1 Tax=Trichostrongylus colubriformis TaxID=6319 RepID=A0AAN8FRI0_TRICO